MTRRAGHGGGGNTAARKHWYICIPIPDRSVTDTGSAATLAALAEKYAEQISGLLCDSGDPVMHRMEHDIEVRVLPVVAAGGKAGAGAVETEA